MKEIITLASGKGGVGKTVITANLGVVLGRRGLKTLAVDLDLGSSNLHTSLGMKNDRPGIGGYIYKKTGPLETLVQNTPYENLDLITRDTLLPGTANLGYFIKRKLLKELRSLEYDIILVDLGAGSSHNTVDFFLAGTKSLLVSQPETTAVLSAYGFLKAAAFRLLFLTFPPRSEERALIREFLGEKLEGTPISLNSLIRRLLTMNPDAGNRFLDLYKTMAPGILFNGVRDSEDRILMGRRLSSICEKNLNWPLEDSREIPHTESLYAAQKKRIPGVLFEPEGDFTESIEKLAETLVPTQEEETFNPSLEEPVLVP